MKTKIQKVSTLLMTALLAVCMVGLTACKKNSPLSRESIFLMLGAEDTYHYSLWPGYEETLEIFDTETSQFFIVSEFQVNYTTNEYYGRNQDGEYYYKDDTTYFTDVNTFVNGSTYEKSQGDELLKLQPFVSLLSKDPDIGLEKFQLFAQNSLDAPTLAELENQYISAKKNTNDDGSYEIELEFNIQLYGFTNINGYERVTWSFNATGQVYEIKHETNFTATYDGNEIKDISTRTIRPYHGDIVLNPEFPNLW